MASPWAAAAPVPTSTGTSDAGSVRGRAPATQGYLTDLARDWSTTAADLTLTMAPLAGKAFSAPSRDRP